MRRPRATFPDRCSSAFQRPHARTDVTLPLGVQVRVIASPQPALIVEEAPVG
jgi:hypothetical protein